LVLGDNILYDHGVQGMLMETVTREEDATGFGYYVANPQAYGVAEFDPTGRVVSIEEKPKSHYAITGLSAWPAQRRLHTQRVGSTPRMCSN
jgi:glucose-1-phosphate thymidylyltransferase